MKWAAMKTVKKGYIGEQIARGILERKGLIIYSCDQDRPHVVDFYCQYPGKDLFAVEVKTYPRQYAYTRTGIDSKDFTTYLDLWKRGIEVLIFFVDQYEQCVYQQRISVLKNFKQPGGDKVYFPLGCMKLLRKLTKGELKRLNDCGAIDQQLYAGTQMWFTQGVR